MTAWILLLTTAAFAAANLLHNGDFEQGLGGWNVRNPWYEKPKGGGLSEVTVADGEGRGGSKALKIIGKGKRGIALQAVPAYPGRYRVTGWIKCQGIDAGAAEVLVEWISYDGKWIRGETAVKVSGDTDWQHFDVTVTAPPATRRVHFDLLTTEPNNGVAWFDDITFQRVPSEGEPPRPPTIAAECPDGAEGCLRVTWQSSSLSPSAVRLLIYCEPRQFNSRDGLIPKAVADTLDGGVTIYGLQNGQRYWLAAVAADADGRASALGPTVAAEVRDRQPPRPGWLVAWRTGDRRARVRWWPHVLDLDITQVEIAWRAADGAEPKSLRTVDVAALYEQPRPLYCIEPWIDVQLQLPAAGGQVGVRCVDRAGNVGDFAWVEPERPFSPPERPGPWQLWAVEPTAQVRRDAQAPADPKHSFELWAMRGESEGFQVVVRPSADLHRAHVVFEDLKTADGTTIPSRWLAYHFVNYVHLAKNSRATPPDELVWRAPADYPDELSDDLFRDLPSGQTQPLFIRVTVPRDAKPGTYTGRAWFVCDEGRQAVDISVRVLPVTFPHRTRLKFVYWFSWSDPCKQFGVEQFSEDGWRVLRRLGELMHAYHQNVVVVPNTLIDAWLDDQGNVVCDFSKFDRFIRTFKAAGVDALFCLSHIGSRTTGEWTCPTMSPHRRTFRRLSDGEPVRMTTLDLLAPVQAHVEQLGMLDRFAVHVADEPTSVNVASYRELSAEVHKHAPKLRRIDAIHVPDLRGALEIWVPQLNFFNEWLDQYRAAQREGYEIWFYVAWVPQGHYPNRMIDSHCIKPRVLHWMNYIYDTTGYLHWALNHWHISLMSLGSPGDQYITWPSRRFIANSSLRYEAERDGLDDCQLMFMLEDALIRRGIERDVAQARIARLARRAVRDFTDFDKDWHAYEQIRRRLLEELVRLSAR